VSFATPDTHTLSLSQMDCFERICGGMLTLLQDQLEIPPERVAECMGGANPDDEIAQVIEEEKNSPSFFPAAGETVCVLV